VTTSPLDVATLHKDFPTLQREVHDGKRLVYLDSGASSQTPRSVLDAMMGYYERSRSNVHRGVYGLAEEATDLYEGGRTAVARLLQADERGVVFTKNATEAFNLLAYSLVRRRLGPGDALLTTEMEHHANFVPYRYAADDLGFEIRAVPVTDDGLLDLEAAGRLLEDGRVKVAAFMHVSNVLGTINPVRELADMTRAANPDVHVLVDGVQAVPHMPVDVPALGVDAYVFTGHKMLGPTGIGGLVADPAWLDDLDPFLAGGDMIREVSLERATWNDVPHKFEAGTPMIAEAAGLDAAVQYLEAVGLDSVRAHEQELTGEIIAALDGIDGVHLYGPRDTALRGSAVSFAVEGVHPHDVGAMLDQHGVCVRVGHHCAKPLMQAMNVNATVRASSYLYNDTDDIAPLVEGLQHAIDFFRIR
jgi:cysteine desulfurase/selenocysteine lyase